MLQSSPPLPKLQPLADGSGFGCRVRFGTRLQARFRIIAPDPVAATQRAIRMVAIGRILSAAKADGELGALLLSEAGRGEIELAERAAALLEAGCAIRPVQGAGEITTMAELAKAWTSGDLARKYPDHVRTKGTAALERWRKLGPGTDLVFTPQNEKRLAEAFRTDLRFAKIARAELFERGKHRRPIRVHDLRATFVTLSLANGKTESWVADRTGHRSSVMINHYRRAARTAAEIGLGELKPLHEAIVWAEELRPNKGRFSAENLPARSRRAPR